MTLALSVLSSSVGMCGAAAATDPPPDADGSNLQVTIVPLANNNNETPAPTAESKTPAQEEETPAENDQSVASTGDNTDQPTDGEGDGDDNTSSDDKPTIERPEQSDTVETLPGTAKDNIDHIKGRGQGTTPKIRAIPARRPPTPVIRTRRKRARPARRPPARRY